MTPTLYTFGYNGARAKQTLAELVALGTPLLDIRKNPNDGTLAWTRDMLVQERGLTYRWVEALGNDFYARHNGDIQIHDMDAGMHVLERVLLRLRTSMPPNKSEKADRNISRFAHVL